MAPLKLWLQGKSIEPTTNKNLERIDFASVQKYSYCKLLNNENKYIIEKDKTLSFLVHFSKEVGTNPHKKYVFTVLWIFLRRTVLVFGLAKSRINKTY